MDYLKLFQTHEEYETFVSGGTMVKPNVSYCEDNNEVHYNPFSWADVYFTTVARGSGEISFNIRYNMGTDMITSISYSTDNGETWNTTNNANDKEENIVISVNVEEGDKVMWKGNATQYGYFDEDEELVLNSFFSSTCEFVAQGNVMSLLYGDDFKGETTIENEYALAGLFSDFYQETMCDIVNAKNLSLPATTLAKGCYYWMFCNCGGLTEAPELTATTLAQGCYLQMFSHCTSLTTAPELPVMTLAQGCYQGMFSYCTSLTTAPELPAETLTSNCYEGMFYGCTSLTAAPNLPATTLALQCYLYMFYGCTSLTAAPNLPATTLAEGCYGHMFSNCTGLTVAPALSVTTLTSNCYSGMFEGCTSLVTAPELPATTLAQGCYQGMFDGCTNLTTAPELTATTLAQGCYLQMFSHCTSLTTAPELPVMTLAQGCYQGMFSYCTSLTTAPELPAETLTSNCYYSMFNGCSKLNYIKAMFTTTPSGTSPNYYTTDWVKGVASSGTFVKNSAATWTTTGNNGIPTGWTVQTASA